MSDEGFTVNGIDVEAEVDRLLDEEVEQRRAALREEVAAKARHKAAMAHLDYVNRPRPEIEDPPSPEEQARLDAVAEASRAERDAKLAANDERWRREQAERDRALSEARAKPRQPPKLDSEGFEIR
jgi:hypothetical protein